MSDLVKSDNPLENATLSKLSKIEEEGPYVYTCRNGKDTVTFPDLAEMAWEDGESFMEEVMSEKESVWLKKWLEPAEYEKFANEHLKMKELVPVIRDVINHYSKMFGTPGEEQASRS